MSSMTVFICMFQPIFRIHSFHGYISDSPIHCLVPVSCIYLHMFKVSWFPVFYIPVPLAIHFQLKIVLKKTDYFDFDFINFFRTLFSLSIVWEISIFIHSPSFNCFLFIFLFIFLSPLIADSTNSLNLSSLNLSQTAGHLSPYCLMIP